MTLKYTKASWLAKFITNSLPGLGHVSHKGMSKRQSKLLIIKNDEVESELRLNV